MKATGNYYGNNYEQVKITDLHYGLLFYSSMLISGEGTESRKIFL
jgi:hypothetical protein